MSDPSPAAAWLQQYSLSLPAIALAAIAVLYLGRRAAHEAIRAVALVLRDGLLQAGILVLAAHQRAAERNREVLLAGGRESTERAIEREFHRMSTVVGRDLSGYPALHRQLADQIHKIDEDYREATEVPPSPPEWVRAVESIATIIPSKGDPFVGRILADIHKTIQSSHKEAMRDYRANSRQRHRLLDKMLPYWRKLDRTLDRVDRTIRGLQERSGTIDQQMETYSQIRANSDRAAQTLAASSMTHFVTSALVLAIALLGGFVNFHLIALPMSEMVGATSYVGTMMVSDIAALVIILTEVAMGLFLMESLRITRLFPVISTMDDQLRRRMIWVSFGILLTLACVEASLAYMRDLLAADREALTQTLLGGGAAEAQLRWIPSLGQMVMGFVLPFALCFAAIPLESFIHSSRTVFGALLSGSLRGLAALLRLAGSVTENLGGIVVHLYDFAIIVPLWIEQAVTKRKHSLGKPGSAVAAQRTG